MGIMQSLFKSLSERKRPEDVAEMVAHILGSDFWWLWFAPQ